MVWQNRGTLPLPLVTRAFGRALARVMAHELYHYLTQSAAHTASELFRPAMTSMDLTMPQVRFESLEIEALRKGISKFGSRAARRPHSRNGMTSSALKRPEACGSYHGTDARS
jgi:hypothetical protein